VWHFHAKDIILYENFGTKERGKAQNLVLKNSYQKIF